MASHGPSKRSHLRQVSTGSAGNTTNENIDGETIVSPTTPPSPAQRLHRRPCSLWVHDDKFSKDDVLFNTSIVPDGSVAAEDLVEVEPLISNSDVQDFQQRRDPKGQSTQENSPAMRPRTSIQILPPEKCTEARQQDSHDNFLFVAKPLSSDVKNRHPNLQLSIAAGIASVFGLRNRTQVLLSVVDNNSCTASHAEIVFRDAYLSRSDLWRLAVSELTDRPVYKGQKILFMGTIKATIKSLYVSGRKVLSAYFATRTIPIFRSESARFVLFIQMSREMWDFDSKGTGEIMFNRVVNGFLPELFKRWQKANARHLVSIVLFTRLDYDRRITTDLSSLKTQNDSSFATSKTPPERLKDFYRVVVSDMASGQWTIILNELKKEFRTFLRDVTVQKVDVSTSSTLPAKQNATDHNEIGPKPVIAGRPTTALRGNILEAINMASSQYSSDYIDRDLVRTGISVVIITAGTGVFEVDSMALARTTESLTNNGIGIDLVCLSKMPLHSVPLFKFRKSRDSPNYVTQSLGRDSIRNLSPPTTHSPIGSFPSQTIEVSPSATTEFGSVTGPTSKIYSLESPEEWDYHIPSWIDVSFWAPGGGSQRSDSLLQSKLTAEKQQTHHKEFVPRVRMYELQMMGVMENEMSNIVIPYLSEDMAALGSASHATRSRNRFFNLSLDPNQDGASSRFPYHSGIPSPLAQSPPFKDESRKRRPPANFPGGEKGSDWIDTYDDVVFRPFRKPRQSKKRRHAQTTVPGPTDLQFSSSKNLGSEKKTLTEPTSKGSSQGTRQNQRSVLPNASISRKTKNVTEAKPARISRQISFALRGLGPAAPRAVASTEISAESVKAAKISSNPTPSNVLTPTNKPSSATETASLESSIGRQEKSLQINHDSPTVNPPESKETHPDTSSTRPINVKGERSSQHGEPIASDKDGGLAGNLVKSAIDSYIPETKYIDIPHKEPHLRSLNPDNAQDDNYTQRAVGIKTGSGRKWIPTVNPCNPSKNTSDSAVEFGRWQHVYPHAPRVSSVKWKSLCSPASVPLTTEGFPSEDEIEHDYTQQAPEVLPTNNAEVADTPKSRQALIRDLISIRLSHGYQFVVGPKAHKTVGQSIDVFNIESLALPGSAFLMSMGNTIQKIVCSQNGQVTVIRFRRKSLPELLDPTNKEKSFTFFAAIRTIFDEEYSPREMKIEGINEPYEWPLVDNFIVSRANPDVVYIEKLRFWRARFILIPVDLPSNTRRGLVTHSEDTPEEIRLEGIRKLTQLWQRYRYVPADERNFQSSLRKKDPNPLDIMYQTRNPSEVIAAELDKSSLTESSLEGGPTQLLPDSELLQRTNINLSSLAQTIQGEKGITIINRRWHWRLHYNCFIGMELTSWLLQNFRDIDTREEAVELGNELMKNGLFQHVEKRHNFRDGNYFYQIGADYRISRSDSKIGWFRRIDKSVPPTPMSDGTSRDSPLASRSQPSSNDEDDATDSAVPTPTKSVRSKVAVTLSKSMRYDVDHRKRSDRPEVIELHYDRIHNPDNCYHFRIDWLNVTSKLVEDAIVTWATTADKYGLKLIEVPMAEASTVSEKEPFRAPYIIRLAVAPPNRGPSTVYNATSFSPHGSGDRSYYQKAILKKFNFVLDLEAATDFPPDVDVCYSWGKPTYRYPQYVHRSGVLLAQIAGAGSLILAANRLYNTRSATLKEASKLEREDHLFRKPRPYGENPSVEGLNRASPHPSPLVRAVPDVLGGGHAHFDMSNISTTPEHIRDELEAFCNDRDQLMAFYETLSTQVSPAHVQTSLDASIPSLKLPPSTAKSELPQTQNVEGNNTHSDKPLATSNHEQSPRISEAQGS